MVTTLVAMGTNALFVVTMVSVVTILLAMGTNVSLLLPWLLW